MRGTRRHLGSSPLSAVLALAVTASVSASSTGCSSGSCTDTCQSSLSLAFDAPIGLPGNYQFVAGPYRCSVELPAVSSGCAVISDFSVVGLYFQDLDSPPPAQLSVTATKDGSEVLADEAAADSYLDTSTCGASCATATYTVHAPEELAPPARAQCDLANLTGTYAVVESSQSGSCFSILGSQTVALKNGLLRLSDPTCSSELVSWSPDTCRAESATACSSSSLEVSWSLALTDLLTDGSRLAGSVQISMSSPLECQGAADLELSRR
jgi:hypothetical protein